MAAARIALPLHYDAAQRFGRNGREVLKQVSVLCLHCSTCGLQVDALCCPRALCEFGVLFCSDSLTWLSRPRCCVLIAERTHLCWQEHVRVRSLLERHGLHHLECNFGKGRATRLAKSTATAARELARVVIPHRCLWCVLGRPWGVAALHVPVVAARDEALAVFVSPCPSHLACVCLDQLCAFARGHLTGEVALAHTRAFVPCLRLGLHAGEEPACTLLQ